MCCSELLTRIQLVIAFVTVLRRGRASLPAETVEVCIFPHEPSRCDINDHAEEGHQSSECPNPRSADSVECKKCGEMGHFAKDCPKPDTCRNCL